MLERVLRYRILIPIIIFYFVMSVLTPLTHDDLEWGTSYGTHMFQTFYETLNGRYLGTVSYTHLTLPTKEDECRSRWSPYH